MNGGRWSEKQGIQWSVNSGQWSEKQGPFDFAQGRLREQANEGPSEGFWFGRFLSRGGSWNHCAPNGVNYRQMEDAENQALRDFMA